jgi:two-component system nitrogen regulation response regulator NtrX
MSKLVYLVDDDKNLRRSLQIALKDVGFEIKVFHDSLSIIQEVKKKEPDVLVLDIQIDEFTGLDIFNKMTSEGYMIPVIFISGHSTLSQAVSGIKMGAFDFIEKPFAPEKLIHTIKSCFEFIKIKNENETLKNQTFNDDFKGESKVFITLLNDIQKVASSQSSVFISGESGTGKELIAKEIHKLSKFSAGPFIKVNCSAIPENLIESEFFGHTKGAFTGADRNKKGFFEMAHQGTIFLDEIGEMSLMAQAKILRVLQNQEIQKLGSENIIPVHFRLVCATNKNLKTEVEKGNFREDLFYRINVFPINSPPLRDRDSDIPLLSYYFLNQYLRINNLPMKQFSEGALNKLINYSWPGNIRELKNVIERIVILGGQILDEKLLSYLENQPAPKIDKLDLPLKEFKNKTEREYLVKILRNCEGSISSASQILEIERTYLHKKIQDYNIQKREYLF